MIRMAGLDSDVRPNEGWGDPARVPVARRVNVAKERNSAAALLDVNKRNFNEMQGTFHDEEFDIA